MGETLTETRVVYMAVYGEKLVGVEGPGAGARDLGDGHSGQHHSPGGR